MRLGSSERGLCWWRLVWHRPPSYQGLLLEHVTFGKPDAVPHCVQGGTKGARAYTELLMAP